MAFDKVTTTNHLPGKASDNGHFVVHSKQYNALVTKLNTVLNDTQGSAIADLGAATTVGANTGTAGAGLSLIGDTTAVNQASNIMNDFVALQEDIDALTTKVNAVIAALETAKIIAS